MWSSKAVVIATKTLSDKTNVKRRNDDATATINVLAAERQQHEDLAQEIINDLKLALEREKQRRLELERQVKTSVAQIEEGDVAGAAKTLTGPAHGNAVRHAVVPPANAVGM